MRAVIFALVASMMLIAVAAHPVLFKTGFLVSDQDNSNALQTALVKAKQECLSEGLNDAICNTISGTASVVSKSTRSCRDSDVCWLVQVRTSKVSDYSAGMFVRKDNNSFTIRDYLRKVI